MLRHSTVHVLAQAVTQLFPGAKFSIGPAIENGFYYDFELPGGADVQRRRPRTHRGARCARSCKANQPFVRSEMSMAEAKALFADQPYKVEIIEKVEPRAAAIDDLDTTDSTDGGVGGRRDQRVPQHRRVRRHVCRPARAVDRPARVTSSCRRSSGAYWRGNEKGPMLQRIYGTAWESKQALADHLHQLEEAAKRDHRKLATELDLLSFPQRARRRPRRVAPEGRDRPQADGGLQPTPPRDRAGTSSSTRRTSPTASSSRRPATSAGTPTACTRRWRWTTARTT